MKRLFIALLMVFPTSAGAQDILPFPPTPSASQAGQKRVEPRRLVADAPNILIVLIDDVGHGTPSTYGGEINTPTLSRIAGMGVSYNRFHSTAMCSPTRASSVTSRSERCWMRVGRKAVPNVPEIEPVVVLTVKRSPAEGANPLLRDASSRGATLLSVIGPVKVSWS